MTLPPVNLLAVLVSAIVTFILGALWYSPMLFGKAWVTAHGYTPEELAARRQTASRAYTVTFLCWLVMAWTLALIMSRIGVDTVQGGLKVGALCWLGFAATVGLSLHTFSQKPLAIWLIDTGYQLASLLVMGVLLALWR